MLDTSRDIHSPIDFKKHTADFVRRLKQTGKPIVLTINGKAELVVQGLAAYQKLREVADEAEVFEGIRQGLEDMEAGRTVSLDDVKTHVRTKHGFRS
jgi:PHD/YefM family antitoxin component YafN of YafNO toxin-antitoxin module